MSRTGWLTSVALCLALAGLGRAVATEPGQVVFDFETGDLQGWEVVEGKFSKLVSNREFEFHHKAKYTKQGAYYLSTLERADRDIPDDNPTGILQSPVFVLTGRSASFLIGGGSHPTTYVSLCTMDGTEVLRASGRNSQTMQRTTWDTTPWIGKPVFLRIVDHHSGGWGHVTFDDFRVEGRLDPQATKARAATIRRATFAKTIEPLRKAIADLTARFGPRYPKGPDYLARLDKIATAWAEAEGAEAARLAADIEALRREALVANPLVSGQPLLFVVRPQYRPDHHNSATMFQTGEVNTGSFVGGGAIKTIDLATGTVKTLLEVRDGIARDPDVSFDGTKILFSMRRNREDDYHIYEMNADGSGLRQITDGSGLTDVDPIYLPDGRILFTSTREPKYCMCNRHLMGNLYTMNADGSNLEQIGHSTLHEGHSALLPDGRVVYDRWEYVDRNFGDAQGLWVTNPDGTNHAVLWGNNTSSPGGVLEARAIPGTELLIATFAACHDRPWGSLAILDRRLGLDGREPVVRTWPAEAIERVGQGGYDNMKAVNPKYEDPYPLSDKQFLCSRMIGKGEQMGLYLLDLLGNEVLLHAETPGCYDPMPLAPRVKPPVIPSRVDLAKTEGYVYVQNVYQGVGMERVKPGSVKYLRVVESPEKRFWTGPAWDGGTGQQAPGMAWNDFNNKRILGTVPVEADGSVFFKVPADTFVYFQLLDDKGMMVQSMRSGMIVRPGETTGCVGCHEDRRSTVRFEAAAQGWKHGPQRLQPWYGPPRLFSYTAEVQPVLDKHCTSCHDYGQEAGQKLNLAGDLGLVFNTSYVELRSKNQVRVVGAGPAEVQMPLTWGSHVSPLAKILLAGHGKPEIDQKVKLDQESFDRLITWIDINAPYYPDYAGGAFRDGPFGRSPLSTPEVKRLVELTGLDLLQPAQFTQLSFTRPEISPLLKRFDGTSDPKYQEALSLLRTGKERLTANPRPDMPGFRLVSPVELAQEKKYEARREAEARMRAAILRGERLRPSEVGNP